MSIRTPLLLSLGVSACLVADTTERSGWGLNGHGDCAESSLQCWAPEEADRVREVSDGLDEVAVKAPEARGHALAAVVDHALSLSPKLKARQTRELQAIRAELASASLDDDQAALAVRRIRQAGVLDLEGGLIGSHMAVLEPMIQAQLDGMTPAAAGVENPFAWAADVVIPDSYPEHEKAMLQEMMTTPLGAVTAGMLIWTGVLRNDYRRENAELFGEYIPATANQPERYTESGLSMTAKVDRIIWMESKMAALVGAATQGGALVLPPAAGALAGVAVELMLLFKIHMKMAMRIAHVYRWDMTNGPNMLMLIGRVQLEGLAGNALDQMLTYNVMTGLVQKALTSRALRQFGLTSSDDIMKFLFTGMWTRLKQGWSQEAMEAAAREVLERGSTATIKQLLGWATLGAMVAVSAGLDFAMTYSVGKRLKWGMMDFMRDLMLQGSTVMADRDVRDCAYELYGQVVGADGNIHEHERRLLLGSLATPYWVSENARRSIGHEEILDHARRVRTASALPAPTDADAVALPACVEDALADADEQHRTVFLGHLYAMMQIDLDEDPQERWIYQKVRQALRGGTLRRIDEDLMNEIERAVLLEVGLSRGIVVNADGEDFNTAEDFGITIQDIAPAMKDENFVNVLPSFNEGWGETFLEVSAAPQPEAPQP